MKAPNVWGQGALFAFSGLEGRTDFRKQMIGGLLGDHPGIHFCTNPAFDLYVDTTGATDMIWDVVTSDVISGRIIMGDTVCPICFVFRSNATVAGICPAGHLRLVFASGKTEEDGVTLTVLEKNGKCSFCLSLEGSTDCSEAGIESEAAARIFFYEKLKVPDLREDIANAFAHAVSVLKSQVYSPEKPFRQYWTTPDRYPHRNLWLWDSCFHSFGNCFISDQLAGDSILSVLDSQLEDGLIPHMTHPDGHSEITQPPVLAWAVEKFVRRTGDTEFAGKCFGRLEKYLKWDMDNRRMETGLYYWHINRESENCRCDESGMDNCLRFDNVEEMECIDFSCFMVREAQAMACLAGKLGKDDRSAYWKEYADGLAKLINERLWDEEDGFYYDFNPKTQALHKIRTVASFLPLFAGICDESRQKRLLAALNDEKQFKAPFSLPAISMSDRNFGTDMWCGPMWMNYTYLTAEGLRRCGENETADRLIANTVEGIARHYMNDGVLYEFYDSTDRVAPPRLHRKGTPVMPYTYGARMQSIRDYGWTASLFVALVLENPELFR